MFNTASKFFFALAGFCVVAAMVWAGATTDHAIGMDTLLGPLTMGWKGYVGVHSGYALLMGTALGSLALGIFLAALRGGDPEPGAEAMGYDEVPEVIAPVMANYWPTVAGFSLATVTIGLAVGTWLVVVGLVGLFISGVEWAIRAWSERATADRELNRAIRNRVLAPVELPGLAILVILGIVLLVSRILLAVPSVAALVVFGLVPTIIFVVGVMIVMRPRLSESAIAGMVVIGALALLVGGIAAAIAGERDHDEDHSPLISVEQGVVPSGSDATTEAVN